jgi:hypothetical protein
LDSNLGKLILPHIYFMDFSNELNFLTI